MTEKLPIFIICGKSPIKSYGGGYSTFAINLAKVLVSLHHRVYIVAVGDKNETRKTNYGTLLIFKSLFFDYYTTALPSLPLLSYIFSNGIQKIVADENIDRFIVWGIGPWGLAGFYLKKKWSKRVIFISNYFTTIKHEWHGAIRALKVKDYGIFIKCKFLLIFYTIVSFLSFFERKIILSADIIITTYHSAEVILRKEFNIPPSRFVRITFLPQVYTRNAKEGKKIKVDSLPKKYILFLSRQDPRKGINFLLHAMTILYKTGNHTPLVIGGVGQMFEANKKLAKKLGISKLTHFVGFVNDTTQLLKRAEIFCFPTVEEGAGAIVINEAMSLGVPIITTRCDGIPEDIEDGKSGLLVPIGDSSALASAIEKLLHDKKYAKTLGRNAQKRYHERFSYKKMREDIERVLEHGLAK